MLIVTIEVLTKNVYVVALGNVRLRFMRVEVAVGAFLHTPGYVDVEA
jgi:hypothetical protein